MEGVAQLRATSNATPFGYKLQNILKKKSISPPYDYTYDFCGYQIISINLRCLNHIKETVIDVYNF